MRLTWESYNCLIGGKRWMFVHVDDCSHAKFHTYDVDITGMSPAHVQRVVEELNIHINNLLFNLSRIPR
jgi:hypothetical protein